MSKTLKFFQWSAVIKTLLAGGVMSAIIAFVAALYENYGITLSFLASLSALALSVIFLHWFFSFYEWILPPKNPVPLNSILKMAQNSGWKFKNETLEILDFMDALLQAGRDGSITLSGRSDRHTFEELTRNERLETIPADHWRDFIINWAAGFVWKKSQMAEIVKDNFPISSYMLANNSRKGFKDLHVVGVNRKWLKAACSFKGRRQEQEDAAKAYNDAALKYYGEFANLNKF